MQLSTIHFPFFFVVLKALLKRFCSSGLLVRFLICAKCDNAISKIKFTKLPINERNKKKKLYF